MTEDHLLAEKHRVVRIKLLESYYFIDYYVKNIVDKILEDNKNLYLYDSKHLIRKLKEGNNIYLNFFSNIDHMRLDEVYRRREYWKSKYDEDQVFDYDVNILRANEEIAEMENDLYDSKIVRSTLFRIISRINQIEKVKRNF